MIQVLIKEVAGFFHTLIGYTTIVVFLLILGLIMWVFPDYSVLNYNFASLDQLFELAPMIFMFLIPAITMSSYSEEKQNRTMELLLTKPISELQIILGKYLGNLVLVCLAILPTIIYVISIHQLGSPPGNIDLGEVGGSYLGLFFLSAVLVAIGCFASSITTNQIVAFLLATLFSFMLFYGCYFISKLPVFTGSLDVLIQQIGIDYHYQSISRGLIDSRDIVYFFSMVIMFLTLTYFSILRVREK